MSNKWNERDLLRLTRDCDLGKEGTVLLVVKTYGPYMTVQYDAPPYVVSSRFANTGRDYAFATKIGEAAIEVPKAPASDTWEALAELVRLYFNARDQFDALNIVAEPQRSRVAAKELERTEDALRAAVAINTEPGASR